MAVADSHNGTSHWHADLLDWVYGGVDHSLPGNGGDDCVNFLNLQQRLMESAFASCFALSTMIWGYFKVKVPPTQSTYTTEPLGKRLLLVLLCLTFGTELGFKFATRQMIWILNPCHLVTMVQIFLLAAPPCRLTMVVFRLHMHMLAGASIALIFPVINTRLLPFETCVYWIQHVLIVTIPYYLMRLGGAYTPERLTDFSWPGISLGILFLYHFLPLQWLAVVSRVNLNNMLCPAISDPFYGQFYRVCAMTHQIILIPTHGKLYTFMASLLLPKHCHPTQDISSKGNHSGHETQKNFDKGRHSYISPNEQLHVSSLSNGMIKHLTKESYTCDCNGHTKLD